MRQVLLIVFGAVLAVSLVMGASALNQANQEQVDLTSRLQSRSQVLSESLADSVGSSLAANATTTLQRTIDRFVNDQRLAGLGIFDSAGAIVATSQDLALSSDPKFITTVMDSDTAHGDFVQRGSRTYYTYVLPLHNDATVIGALAVVQDASYINDSIVGIWWGNIMRWFFLVLLFGLVAFALVRWVFVRAIADLTESLQEVRRGESDAEDLQGGGFFRPLTGELTKVAQSLRQARHIASQEARMRLEKLDSPWTAERLREFIKLSLKDRPIYVLSNREPYVHELVKNKVEWSVPAGGLVTALEPVMEACGGMWIAHGSGSADKQTADKAGKLRVPPDEPQYTLKRIWLTPEELKGYYSGFSNEALWPLSHMAHTRPLFRAEDWAEYKKVNGKFAKALLTEIQGVERPIILVQDYHLMLVPKMIKKSRPDALVAIFWHIPWPSAAQFAISPWRAELLEGVLGADLIGFHTQQYCNNFIDTVANEIESRIDYETFSIVRGGHETRVRPFPISIAFSGTEHPLPEADRAILEELGITAPQLALGVDRLDYTKGLLERFKAFEFLLDEHEDLRGQLTLLQIASPSRESVEKYREYAEAVTAEAERINKKFGTGAWRPIVLEKRNYRHEQLAQLYRLANVCLVTSLHDGMNLVAKEYVAARDDEEGVLVLSKFAGASRDLKSALIVNPYSAEETSGEIYKALTMPKSEQHRRMKALRASVRDYNTYRWSAEIIKALVQLN